jgi:signal transduction histidine kinase
MFPLAKLPKALVITLSVLAAMLIGYVDWLIDPRILMLPFYLLPIGITAWFAGRAAGVFVALICCLVRLLTDAMGLVQDFSLEIELWNLLIGLLAFLVVVELVHRTRKLSQSLERLVEDRTATLFQEITERKRAEDVQRELTLQLSEAEETERARLAADLHDSVGQSLSLLKLNLGALRGPIGYDGGKAPPDLMESLDLIDDIVKQVRTFTFRIHPMTLEDLGLIPTLRWYAEQFEAQAGTRVTVSESGERQPLSAPVANYLFRAIKELLNNAAKHGKAGEVVIAAHWRPEGLRMVIDDDGCGFDPAQIHAPQLRRGLGLAGIRERVLALHGKLTLESAADQGTRVILDIGLANRNDSHVPRGAT